MLDYGKVMQSHDSEDGDYAAAPRGKKAGKKKPGRVRVLVPTRAVKQKRLTKKNRSASLSNAATRPGRKLRGKRRVPTAQGGSTTRREAPPMAKRKGGGKKKSGKSGSRSKAKRGTNLTKRQRAARKGARTKARKHAERVAAGKKSARKAKKRGGKRKSAKRKSAKRASSKKSGGKRKSAKRVAAGKKGARTRKRNKSHGHTAKRKSAKRGKRKSAKRSGKRRAKRGGGSKIVRVRLRPTTIKVSEKKRRRGHRHARETYALENPLGGAELAVGAFTLLIGFGTADVLDRFLATHALTDNGKASDGSAQYMDTPTTDGDYPGLYNGAAVIAPMGWKRWAAGGAVTIVPIVAAHFVKAPVGRSALQMFGFGAGARVLGKGMIDGLAWLTRKFKFSQQLYAAEQNAAALHAAKGNSNTVEYAKLVKVGLAAPARPGQRVGTGCGSDCGCGDCMGLRAGVSMLAPAPSLNRDFGGPTVQRDPIGVPVSGRTPIVAPPMMTPPTRDPAPAPAPMPHTTGMGSVSPLFPSIHASFGANDKKLAAR